MTGFRLNRYLVVSVGLLAATGMISGCSKQQAQSSGTQPVASDAAATSAPAPETPAADAAAQPPTGPVLDASQMEGTAKQAMAEADAALRQKEYEKAVRTMLAIQQAQLNAQQAAAAHQQMLALQKNLALGVANGDPNAIAAAQLLRAGHSH
jgi:FtsZ-interacting cell division protein ZipA